MRPRLRRSFDVRLTDDDRLFLLGSPRQGDSELEGDGRALAALLTRLDGTASVVELARGTGIAEDELGAVLGELESAGFVDDADLYADALSDADRERFDRQLDVFADHLGGAAEAASAQARLRSSTVCILGLGGLGSWVAWGLASAGVGAIVGVDGDVVEASNFNRQILYSWADVGRLKVEAAGEALRRFDPGMTYVPVARHVTGVEDAREVIRGADLVVATIDQPSHLAEHWVQEACFADGRPVLALTQHPPLVRVGPLYVPGETGCLECQESRWRDDWDALAALQVAAQVRAPSSTYGPACGVVGTLAAGEVIAALTGLYAPTTLGAEQIVDLSTMTVERRVVPRLPGCGRCG